MAYSGKTALGQILVVSVRDTDTVLDLKKQYARSTGVTIDDVYITFHQEELKHGQQLHQYGIKPGKMTLVFQEHTAEETDSASEMCRPHCLAVSDIEYDPVSHIITVKSSTRELNYPDLVIKTIRLSCQSHSYTSGKNYGGFILYGWQENKNTKVKDDWRLNGIHCLSGYMVIQDTDDARIKQYCSEGAPGIVHGAVYWNVFGYKEDPGKAVGEAFALVNGEYRWNSRVFNAKRGYYHDGKRNISELAGRCVKKILDDWQCTSQVGKNYAVEELLG